MVHINNPFITAGYVSAEYFCDRQKESDDLINQITNGNNIALISPRRMGKTGLIMHCFDNDLIHNYYYTFFVDIYAAKSLNDFVLLLSRVILEKLKPFGKRAIEIFVNCVRTLQPGISFDVAGNPSFNVQLGDLYDSHATLDEIFKYLNAADKPCIVAIDEFQQIASFPEKNIEAILRTHIQHCNNAHFIFAGSQRHIMGNMFLSPSKPFYQSVSMLYLEPISLNKYSEFVICHFNKAKKQIAQEVIETIYHRYDGITWYMQKMMNTLFMMTNCGECCNMDMIDYAQKSILDSYSYNYQETLFRLPERQKELLITIAKEGRAKEIMSSAYIKKYRLASASSVQAALKGLLGKDFISSDCNEYYVYDKFFALWLVESF